MKVKYLGPKPEVQLVHPLRSCLVKRGETVDVPDEVALGLKDNSHWEVGAKAFAEPAEE